MSIWDFLRANLIMLPFVVIMALDFFFFYNFKH